MSDTRKRYIIRLVCRILILIACAVVCFVKPEAFSILDGMNFFRKVSVFHLLWLVWVIDMIFQIIPIRNTVPLGSQKLFANRFCLLRDKFNLKACINMWSPPPKLPTS